MKHLIPNKSRHDLSYKCPCKPEYKRYQGWIILVHYGEGEYQMKDDTPFLP